MEAEVLVEDVEVLVDILVEVLVLLIEVLVLCETEVLVLEIEVEVDTEVELLVVETEVDVLVEVDEDVDVVVPAWAGVKVIRTNPVEICAVSNLS